MKKRMIFFVVSMVWMLVATTAHAAGFGLYEASARGNALGGTLIGSTGDASANYYNPANLTELTNLTFMVGVTAINPFADVYVNNQQQAKMNAGWFPPYHLYVAVPLMKDLVLGFGSYCEYGLGTKYDSKWALRGDTTETTMEQFTFNPNLAYKIADWWSVGVGARISYLSFENFATPLDMVHAALGPNSIRTHLKGDDVSCGWIASMQFKIMDDLKMGLVYRSRLEHSIKGDYTRTASGVAAGLSAATDAHADLTLPSSLVLGLNYNATKRYHISTSIMWTEWSTVDTLTFHNVPDPTTGRDKVVNLKWRNAWRFGLGMSYDFNDAWTGMLGYAYDFDPSHKNYGTTMLPSGDRHIVSFGLGYKVTSNITINASYGFIMMESETREMNAHNPNTGAVSHYKFKTDNSYSHLAAISVAYTF